jgi:4-hydroxy-3-polyprenylbenzoate decarboxylase
MSTSDVNRITGSGHEQPPTVPERPQHSMDAAAGSRTYRVVIGITGASGAAYAQRIVSHLVQLGHEVHIVITNYGKRLLQDELGMEAVTYATLHALTGLKPGADPRERGVVLHPAKDVGASLGSGSFRHDGMIVIPCSSNTLGAIASGYGNELLTRAAACALKERFPLVICHREAPLNRVDMENYIRLHDAGATIMPTNPGFYYHPQSVQDLVDFVAARALDQIGIPHRLSKRWNEHLAAENRRDR